MLRVPLGNDVNVRWRINETDTNGASVPYNLEGHDLQVEIRIGLYVRTVTDFTVDGNLISFTYLGRDQKKYGPVTFWLIENAGKVGMHTLDKAGELELVDSTSKAGGASGSNNLAFQTLQLYSVLSVLEDSAIPETIARKTWVNGKLANYFTKTDADARYLQGVNWEDIGEKPSTLAGYGITDAKIQGGEVILGNGRIRPLTEHQSIAHLATKEEVGEKVDKVPGKSLSPEEFSSEEKSKLGGIASGAQVNVIEGIQKNGADLPITGKKVNIEVPTKTSDIQNDSDFTTNETVQGLLDVIRGKIPEQATSENQLADKAFVNSSVATNTANYISNNGQPFASLASLLAYAGAKTNNDYAFVVGVDAAGNTTYTRYKYNAATGRWAEEFVLNNSSFTAAQWGAIMSGITSALVEKLNALPTKTDLDAALGSKQGTISDLQEIRSGAQAGATAYQKPTTGIPNSDLSEETRNSLNKANTALQEHQNLDHLATKDELSSVANRTTSLEGSVEELLLGSHDHMAAAWAKEQMSPTAVKTAGDMSLVNFEFNLIDHNRNTDERSEPVGKLRRNNLLRFKDGSFAPVIGITAAMAAECMGNDLYLNGELYAASGAFDAESFYLTHCSWAAGQDGVVRLQHPVLRKGVADGDEVTHYLMPWETTSKDYSVMLGHDHQLYYMQNVEGTSGRVWNFITTAPKTWDGLGPVSVKPSAFSPSPVAVITDNGTRKSRCAFYAYDGESAVSGNGGAGDSGGFVTLLRNTGKTFPASSVMSQVTTMQYARNNNSDPSRNYPFAEGGWALYNLFVTWLEIKYGTRNLAGNGKFQSGISSNDACSSEATWRANGGVRCRPQGGDVWEYRAWSSAPSIVKKNANGEAPSNWSAFMNNYRPKEACMESQMAASFAVEAGVAEGVEFEMYGDTYTWASVPGTDNLEHGHMNAIIRSIRTGTFQAYNAAGESTTFEVEFCLRMSLYEGANLSGDIFRYWGGGLEIIGNCISNVGGHTGDPVDIFFEPDQLKWVTDTATSHNDGAAFVAESHYEKLASSLVKGNGYALADVPMTPWQVKNGAGFSQGMCHYCYTQNYWSTVIGARVRIGVRFAGIASNGYCAPHYVAAYSAAGNPDTHYGGSAQVLIGESAAAPQAQ